MSAEILRDVNAAKIEGYPYFRVGVHFTTRSFEFAVGENDSIFEVADKLQRAAVMMRKKAAEDYAADERARKRLARRE